MASTVQNEILPLAGRRVALVGKLGGVNRKQAQQTKLRSAKKNKDWKSVLSVYDDMLDHNPDDRGVMMSRFKLLLLDMQESRRAYKFGDKVISQIWDEAMMLNDLAWTVVDNKKVVERDLDFAQRAAMRANELTDSKDAAMPCW